MRLRRELRFNYMMCRDKRLWKSSRGKVFHRTQCAHASSIHCKKGNRANILSYLVLPYLALPCLAVHCLALPCLALPCLALLCLALPSLALRYLAFPCRALHCLTCPCLAWECLRMRPLGTTYLKAIVKESHEELPGGPTPQEHWEAKATDLPV